MELFVAEGSTTVGIASPVTGVSGASVTSLEEVGVDKFPREADDESSPAEAICRNRDFSEPV